MKRRTFAIMVATVISQSTLGQELRELNLIPSTESEVILENFKIFEVEDAYLFTSGGPIRNGEYSGFSFSIDLETGTYTTKAMDPVDVAMRVNSGRASIGKRDTANMQRTLDVTCSMSLTIQTLDPLNWTLAQTDAYIDWEEDSTAGTVRPTYALADPWANPLTPAFTTWYLDGPVAASINPSIGIAGSTIQAFAAQDYINYDWLDDELETNAYHTMSIDLWPEDSNGDIGHWERDALHAGESSSFLTGNYYGGGSCS